MKGKNTEEIARMLLNAALTHAADESEISLELLLSHPEGSRRHLHDDITILIIPLFD